MIEIEDADAFFEKLKEDVTAIEEFSKPHPLSVGVAVTKLKRYLAEPRYRIQLSDLIEETVQEVVETISGETFRPTGPNPTSESITERVRAYDAACSKLSSMAVVAGRWAEADHWSQWQRALERLSGTRRITEAAQPNLWRDLQRYPATLLLYSLGPGAVDGNHLEFLNSLLTAKVRVEEKAESVYVRSRIFGEEWKPTPRRELARHRRGSDPRRRHPRPTRAQLLPTQPEWRIDAKTTPTIDPN